MEAFLYQNVKPPEFISSSSGLLLCRQTLGNGYSDGGEMVVVVVRGAVGERHLFFAAAAKISI